MTFPSPCVVVLVGPAGSGKTTWAETTFGAQRVVSSDRLRALVGTGEDDLDASADAFALLDRVVEQRLARRLTTVIDTLGFDPDLRARWRELAEAAGLACLCVVFDTPASLCRTRNAGRVRRVPVTVLTQQLRTFAVMRDGLDNEGFAEVRMVRPETLPSGGAVTVPVGDTPAVPVAGTPAVRVADSAVADTPAAPVADSGAVAGAPAVRVGRGEWEGDTPAAPADAKPRLRVGLVLSSLAWDGPLPDRLKTIATHAEESGFASIWVMDHLRQIPQIGRAWDPLPEAFTTLAWMAAVTERVRLGPLVTSVTLRPIGLLATMIATLDVLSNGRAVCGLGVGWFEAECRAVGIEFPPIARRYAVLEDALQALPVLWGPGSKAYVGPTVQMPEAMGYPRPVQAKVPIVVGGGGERRTLALAARYGDACNVRGPLEVIAHKIAVLRGHCERFGRDPSEVAVTVLADAVLDDPHGPIVERLRPRRVSAEKWAVQVGARALDGQVEYLHGLEALGVSEVMLAFPELAATGDPAVLVRFGEVLTAL